VARDQPEKTGMEVGSSSNSPESTAQSQQRHPRNCGATPGTRFEAKLLDPPTRIQEKARLLMMPTKVERMPLSEYSRLSEPFAPFRAAADLGNLSPKAAIDALDDAN